MADICEASVHHDLNAVGPATLVAVRNVPNAAADAFGRYVVADGGVKRARQRAARRDADQPFEMCASRRQFGFQVSQVRSICPAILSGSAPGSGSNFWMRPAKQSAR